MQVNTCQNDNRRESARPSGRRGFVFTVDSVIALGFALGFIAFMAAASRTGPNVFAYSVSVQNYAEDSANVLDKLGVLNAAMQQTDSAANATILALLNKTLPPGYSETVVIQAYQYQSSGSCSASCRIAGSNAINNFCLCRNFTSIITPAGAPGSSVNATFVGSENRVFFTNNAGSNLYGLAVVTVWVN